MSSDSNKVPVSVNASTAPSQQRGESLPSSNHVANPLSHRRVAAAAQQNTYGVRIIQARNLSSSNSASSSSTSTAMTSSHRPSQLNSNLSSLPSQLAPSIPVSTTASTGNPDMTLAAHTATTTATSPSPLPPSYDELKLLHDSAENVGARSKDHELRTAPIITRDAYVAAGYQDNATQYGVLGRTVSIFNKSVPYSPVDPRLYINTNTPFSAVICGVQGSGKSHTVSILLESMLIPGLRPIGSLQKPLSGLVLHFGDGGPSARPSEAAWIGSSSLPGVKTPKIKVYVSKSSLNTMKTIYAPLGGAVIVEPLLFSEDELDAQAFLSMMAVGSSESVPLYIHGILSILRDLGENFSYQEFMKRLDGKKEGFNMNQLVGLEQRMALLTSFLDNRGGDQTRFAAGQLTIVDLTDPFIDPASACGLFEILTRLFVRANVGTGKVLVVDEAHKYLSPHKSASGLTKSLLTLTREQRHLAMRVIISTQEPTVIPPVLLDLCTVSILHRFSSPSWWEHLAKHVSAEISSEDAFDRVVKLQTGEAIVLAPSGFGVFPDAAPSMNGQANAKPNLSSQIPKLNQFGRRYILMKTRRRVTKDGGASILVIE